MRQIATSLILALLVGCGASNRVDVRQKVDSSLELYTAGDWAGVIRQMFQVCRLTTFTAGSADDDRYLAVVRPTLLDGLIQATFADATPSYRDAYFFDALDAATKCGILTLDEEESLKAGYTHEKAKFEASEAGKAESDRAARVARLRSSSEQLSVEDFQSPGIWADAAIAKRALDSAVRLFSSGANYETAFSSIEGAISRGEIPTSTRESLRQQLVSHATDYGKASAIARMFPENAAEILRPYQVSYKIEFQGFSRADQYEAERQLNAMLPWLRFDQSERKNVLYLEKVAADFDDGPLQSEAVVIERANVDFAAALLLMPQNSTYNYDRQSQDRVLSYDLFAEAKGKPKEPVRLVGTLKSTMRKCANTRIINAFGGVLPANFAANDTMKYQCSETSIRDKSSMTQEVMQLFYSNIAQMMK